MRKLAAQKAIRLSNGCVDMFKNSVVSKQLAEDIKFLKSLHPENKLERSPKVDSVYITKK